MRGETVVLPQEVSCLFVRAVAGIRLQKMKGVFPYHLHKSAHRRQVAVVERDRRCDREAGAYLPTSFQLKDSNVQCLNNTWL